jgi:hypothetical protein
MSWFGNVFDFEKFNLKDMFGKIKKDPERILIGAADPISSKAWGGLLGKKYEPLVDQMGGAYGGHMFSAFDNKDGGVYGRANAAGIDTKAGGSIHDAAHVISALYAGNYGLDKLGGIFNGGGASQSNGSLDIGSMQLPQSQEQDKEHAQEPIQVQPWEFRPYIPSKTVYQPLSLRGIFG